MDRATLVDELIADEDVSPTYSEVRDALDNVNLMCTRQQNQLEDYARRFRQVYALLHTMELSALTHSEKHGVVKIALRWLQDGQPTTAADEIPF